MPLAPARSHWFPYAVPRELLGGGGVVPRRRSSGSRAARQIGPADGSRKGGHDAKVNRLTRQGRRIYRGCDWSCPSGDGAFPVHRSLVCSTEISEPRFTRRPEHVQPGPLVTTLSAMNTSCPQLTATTRWGGCARFPVRRRSKCPRSLSSGGTWPDQWEWAAWRWLRSSRMTSRRRTLHSPCSVLARTSQATDVECATGGSPGLVVTTRA